MTIQKTWYHVNVSLLWAMKVIIYVPRVIHPQNH